MHHQIIGTTGMGSESHMSQDHGPFGGGGGGGQWVDMAPYTQTTMPDYGHHYTFGLTPVSHALPSESIHSRMGPPPLPPLPRPGPHHNHPHQHPGLANLNPLVMPSNPTWPSQLTNPGSLSHPSSYSAPPAMTMAPPLGVPLKTSKSPATQSAPTPRKTLTNEIRREMCIFSKDNPTMKQAEIGHHFGVERSTVSKILNNKEKYLNPDEQVESPVKRSNKGKAVDIEKALANWVRNRQKSGAPVSDLEIREKAQVFYQNTGAPSDKTLKQFSSAAWMEKFKQKNGITNGIVNGITGGPKLLRRASEANIGQSTGTGIGLAGATAALSPSSPHQQVQPSQSPVSPNTAKSEDEEDGGGSLMEFRADGETALRQATFSFSSEPHLGGFLADPGRNGIPGSASFQRPRSQTFPTLDIDMMNQTHVEESVESKYHPVPSTAPSSALESPMNEMLAQPFAIDTSLTSHHLHRTSSSNSLTQRSGGTPVVSTPAGPSPCLPSQEDARRAADTLLYFIQQNGGSLIDHNDYNNIVRLTEKLRLQPHQSQVGKALNNQQTMMGGLSRIPEGDVEMGNTPSLSMSMDIIKVEPTTMAT